MDSFKRYLTTLFLEAALRAKLLVPWIGSRIICHSLIGFANMGGIFIPNGRREDFAVKPESRRKLSYLTSRLMFAQKRRPSY